MRREAALGAASADGTRWFLDTVEAGRIPKHLIY